MASCQPYPLHSFASSYFSHSLCHILLALRAVLCCSQLFSAACCPPLPPPPADGVAVPHPVHSHSAASHGPFAVPPCSLFFFPAFLFASSCWEQPRNPSSMTVSGVGRFSHQVKSLGVCRQKSDARGVFEREKWTTYHQQAIVRASRISPTPALMEQLFPGVWVAECSSHAYTTCSETVCSIGHIPGLPSRRSVEGQVG